MTVLEAPSEPRVVRFTYRELDVLREFMVDGKDNAQIGRCLYMSEDTVKTHMRHIFRKARVTNRAELAIVLLRGGISLLDPRGRNVLVGAAG